MKKSISLILAVMMVLSMFVMPSYAEDAITFYENCGVVIDADSYVQGFPNDTRISAVKDRTENEGITFTSDKGVVLADSDLLGTGTELALGDSKATAVIKGDITGDGKLTSQDYLLLRKTFSGSKVLEAEYFNAADINNDGKIRSADYLALKKYFQGGALITEPLADMPQGSDIVTLGPSQDETVDIANKLVKAASKSSSFDNVTYEKFNPEHTDVFRPDGVKISWLSRVKGATVKIATKEDLSDAMTFETESNTYFVKDLFAGSDYYYQLVSKDGTVITPVTKFTTAFQPRTIDIYGISNTRDIGGWITADGTKRIKQGILYRGEGTSRMTRKGMEDFTDKYGIKTDISLSGSDVSVLLQDKVNVNYCEILTYGNMYSCEQKYLDNFRNALLLLTDENNFPAYFHCYIGRDRTATFAITLLALCGVKKLDIQKEYALSFLAESGWRDGHGPTTMMVAMDTYLGALGDDLQGSVRTYLRNKVGLTDEQMDKIVENITVPA